MGKISPSQGQVIKYMLGKNISDIRMVCGTSKGHSKKADVQYTTSLMIKFHEEHSQEKHV